MTDSRQDPPRDDLDALLDRAIQATRADAPSEAVVAEAGARAWARVSEAAEQAASLVGPAGASDYEALIPDYLAGRLTAARASLVAAHIREDPLFRAAVEAARTGQAPRRLTAVAPAGVTTVPRGLAGLGLPARAAGALALAAALALALAAFLFARDFVQPQRVLAQVTEAGEGLVLVSGDRGGQALAAGATIHPRQRLRTGREGGALLTLADGSTLELGPRAELSLGSRWNGLAVDLARGDLIVQAADQGRGRLRVVTGDLDAVVEGTIFAVRHGTKGSRVSVVEGQVEVAVAEGRRTLEAGMQYSSGPALTAVPLAQDLAWSRHSAAYLELLAELEKLGQEIDSQVERPAPRRASALVAAVPADTVLFMALPNLGQTLAESYTRLQAGVAENPALADWWSQTVPQPETAAFLDTLVAAMADLSAQIGDEIVVTAALDAEGEIAPPVLMAQVRDVAAFRGLLEATLADIGTGFTSQMPTEAPVADEQAVRLVTDRAELADLVAAEDGPDGAAAGEGIVVWVGGDRVLASPAASAVWASLEGPRGLPADFAAAIAAGYGAGIDALLAIDLQRLPLAEASDGADGKGGVGAGAGGDGGATGEGVGDGVATATGRTGDAESLAALGLAGARYAVASQVTAAGRSRIEASLSFNGDRAGMAGWLAAPGPMGALDFVSPAAYAAGAVLLDRPEKALAEFLGLARALEPEMAGDPDALRAAELVEALARPLGGEVAFALDGPVLPQPAWKMVVEVADPPALQAAITALVEALNERLAGAGGSAGAPRLGLSQGRLDGRTMWRLALVGEADFPAMHWLYADGYLVAAPDPGLLSAALKTRASGVTLRGAAAFRSALPAGAETNFSALAWQDLGRLTRPFAGALPQAADGSSPLVPGEEAAVAGLMQGLTGRFMPSLAYAWAEPDRLRFAASSEASPLGMGLLFQLLGLAGAGETPRPLGPALEGIPLPLGAPPAWEQGA